MVDIALVILLFPVAWTLGASVIYFHISALVMLGLLLSKRNVPVRIPSIILPMVGLALAYLCSLMLNASGVGTTRLIASSYNLSIWFLGITITIVVANADLDRFGNDLAKAAGILCLVAGTGVVLAGLAWYMGSSDLILEAPLSRIAPSWLFEGDLFRQSTELKVLQQDWINGHNTVRSSFLAPYPTVLGAIAAWAIIFVWFGTKTDNPWHRWRYPASALGVIALLGSVSRTAVIALLIAMIAPIVIRRRRWAMGALLAIMAAGIVAPFAEDIVQQILELRAGSSEYRISLYEASLEAVFSSNPIVGLGVKPRDDLFSIPVGSHSTMLGTFVKTGFLGFAFLVIMQVMIVAHSIALVAGRQRNISAGSRTRFAAALSCLALTMWMVTEDIDAPAVVAFLYFTSVGIVFSCRKTRAAEIQSFGCLIKEPAVAVNLAGATGQSSGDARWAGGITLAAGHPPSRR